MASSETSLAIENLQKNRRCRSLDLTTLSMRPPLPPPFSVSPRKVSTVISLPGIIIPNDTEGSSFGEIKYTVIYTDKNNIYNEIRPEIRNNSSQVVAQTLLRHKASRKDSPGNILPKGQDYIEIDLQTPTRSYRVYNDDISPEMQPQTPANLPESRHRSRYHPSFIGPAPQLRRKRRLTRVVNGAEFSDGNVDSILVYPSFERDISATGLTSQGFDSLDQR